MTMQLNANGVENIVFLRVGWDAYQTLLDELGDTPSHRLAYDGEILEIMSPSPPHEKYIRLIDKLLSFYADKKNIELENLGSFTMQWEPRGAEPDSSYYIQNASAVFGKDTIDFAIDPPPDLVLEVDISRSRIDKSTIYASMRIPEYWRYDGRVLRGYELVDREYIAIAASRVLNGLLISDINRFMEMRYTTQQTEIGKRWVQWLTAES